MKTLIAGTSYLADPMRVWLGRLWWALGKELNPNSDLLITDTPSQHEWPSLDGLEVVRFPDNIGHLTGTGKDGWGRATIRAIEIAIEREYDYLALLDADLIFCQSAETIFQHMAETSTKACGVRCPIYNWIEGLLFFNVQYLKDIDFVGQYDWPNMRFGETPERKIEQIIKPDLRILQLPGIRDDWEKVSPYKARSIVWLTHNADPQTYVEMIRTHCPAIAIPEIPGSKS